jgi:hypothetical protein
MQPPLLLPHTLFPLPRSYDWRAFLMTLFGPAAGLLLWAAGAAAARGAGIEGPGISGVVMRIPGEVHTILLPCPLLC